MPKGKSKKFIDKKNSVTFHLVHRSQQDPLAADETAPQRVLVPVGETQVGKSEKKQTDLKKRKEEQKKYGIFFDDDYDYLQHLKDVNSLPLEWEKVENPNEDKHEKKNDAPKINLPSSVFASEVEEEVGLLNKAAPVSGPRLDYDPDIVAAMDDDFNYDDPDNVLQDNFIELANGAGIDASIAEEDEYDSEFDEEEEEEEEDDDDEASNFSSGHMAVSDEERDEVESLNGCQFTFKDEETRSRFTQYSMSSSVIRRNNQLTLLDDKFERMFAGYDENEIGPLDCEEIEGYVAPDSEIMLQYAKEFESQQNEAAENMTILMKDRLKLIEREASSSDDEEGKLEELAVDPREREKWDCESILSTYSNIYNHPKLISEPKNLGKITVDPRTGIPKNILSNQPGKLTTKNLEELDRQNELEKPRGVQSIAETMKSTLSILSVRPKNELPEERRERKHALKNYRKERRIERKANIEAFKEEKKRQEKILLNNKQNVQGNRIL